MNRLQSLKLIGQASIVLLFFVILSIYSSVGFRDGETTARLEHSSVKLSRTRRSPFIVAFQVTRPPGLFQLSMRKPVIMGVMSNMTSMILGSELARMFSRGYTSQQILLPLNLSSTSNVTSEIIAK
ncbi:unnamed protein product [Orchesella dallaii]|uniref:Uncharacterized protein n=1 Tax=Orchesella dallaii TaxID=48710 RepID=A0ABP1S5C1_9HEXA